MLQIITPHTDFDLGFPRKPINYKVDIPDAHINNDCGLIFFINGYSGLYDDIYSNKLRRFLSDKYNCIVCTVDYFGSHCFTYDEGLDLGFGHNFFIELKNRFGMNVTISKNIDAMQIIEAVFQNLKTLGVVSLPVEMHLSRKCSQYQSFSVLPALDHIQVLYALLEKYPIDKKRIFVIGTSYGGNIALFMNKIAPNTIRLLIDNSGFSSSEESLSTIYGFAQADVAGIECPIRNVPHFSSNPDHLAFFSPHHAALRFLADPFHYSPSETVVHTYHSSYDVVAPIREKRRLHEVLGNFRTCMLHVVEREDQLDGSAFKNLEHGMNASMRALFEKSYAVYMDSLPHPPDHTDFDLETKLVLPCAGREYHVSYSKQGVRINLV